MATGDSPPTATPPALAPPITHPVTGTGTPNATPSSELPWALLIAVALDLWLVGGFLIYRIVDESMRWLVVADLPCIRLGYALLESRAEIILPMLFVAWVVFGICLWRAEQRCESIVKWIVCEHEGPAGNGSENGTPIFATLAGFALAQGAALTAVPIKQDRDKLVLGIYAVAVIFSYVWTRQMLLSGTARLKAFDITTHLHAKYSLSWIVFCGTIMFTLGAYGLLPNQTNRIPFRGQLVVKSDMLQAKRDDALGFLGGSKEDVKLLQSSIIWLGDLDTRLEQDNSDSKTSEKKRLVWIEQSDRFQGYYLGFTVSVDCTAKSREDSHTHFVQDAAAFLVRRDEDGNVVYRAGVPRKRLEKQNGHWTPAILDIPGPNPRDTLIIIAEVAREDGTSVTTNVDELGLTVVCGK